MDPYSIIISTVALAQRSIAHVSYSPLSLELAILP